LLREMLRFSPSSFFPLLETPLPPPFSSSSLARYWKGKGMLAKASRRFFSFSPPFFFPPPPSPLGALMIAGEEKGRSGLFQTGLPRPLSSPPKHFFSFPFALYGMKWLTLFFLSLKPPPLFSLFLLTEGTKRFAERTPPPLP